MPDTRTPEILGAGKVTGTFTTIDRPPAFPTMSQTLGVEVSEEFMIEGGDFEKL